MDITTADTRITVVQPGAVTDVVAWCESTEDPSVWCLRTEPSLYPHPGPLTRVSSTITVESLVELVQRAIQQCLPPTGSRTRVTCVEIRGHLALEDSDGRERPSWTAHLHSDSDRPWDLSPGPDWSPISALTRGDHERELPEGADPLVREIHLARTAPVRHESRVRATKLALSRAVLGHDVPGTQRDYAIRWVRESGDGVFADPITSLTDAQRGIASALVALDSHGVGGPGGLGGAESGTGRMFWSRGLGKGRVHASDGPAWMAALTSLGLPVPAPADVERAGAVLDDDDAAFALAYAMHQAYVWRSDTEASARWCAVARVMAAQISGADSAGGRLAARYGLEIERAS